MSYHEVTYIPYGHKTYPEIKEISNKFQWSHRDCLAGNYVSKLPYVVYLEKQKIKVNKLTGIWKG